MLQYSCVEEGHEGEEKGWRAECVYDVQTNGMNVNIKKKERKS